MREWSQFLHYAKRASTKSQAEIRQCVYPHATAQVHYDMRHEMR